MITPYQRCVGKGFDSRQIFIRPMTDDDRNSFCFLFQSVFSQEPWNENWTVSKVDTSITRQMKKWGFVGMAAATRHIPVGYLTGFRLWLMPSIFYIDQLFVSTDYQGLNIGKRLLIETELHLKSQYVSRIFLLTKPRSYVEKFYTKNGYKSLLQQVRIKGKTIFYKQV